MSCFHCQQKIINPVSAKITGVERNFCCSGCLNVCKIITENNLDNFYTQQSNNSKPIFSNQYPLEYYDLPEFKNEFIIDNKITLTSPNIHCAACIWLIEKTISKTSGVVNIRANLSNQRINIVLENDAKFSKIIEQLSKLGYGSEPLIEGMEEKLRANKNKQMLGRLGFSAFAMMNLLWISISLYTGASGGVFEDYFLWISFALATPTLFYIGAGILKSAFTALKYKSLNMDSPISIGALTTYFYSFFVLIGVVDGHIYFDTVVNFIFVILIGRFLEASVKKSALSDTNNYTSTIPKVATFIKDGKQKIVAISALVIGDKILVKTGEKIPVDGEIIDGSLSVDEAIITGESLPIAKNIGDRVLAGSINNSGTATIKTLEVQNSTIRKIMQMVENASNNKAKIECTIDKYIPYFVITTIFIAILAFAFNYNSDFDLALMAGVSVLIITCPCAFGIAVPIVNSVASSLLLKNKIIIKNNNILETIGKVETVIFDKTGTLTTGDFRVLNHNSKSPDFMQIIASLASFSNHPQSLAISKNYVGKLLPVNDFCEVKGLGVSGIIAGKLYKLGNAEFTNWQSKTDDNLFCLEDNQEFGSLKLSDELNLNAFELVQFLQNIGKKVVILSGDNQKSVQNIAKKLGVDEYYFAQKPQNKLDFVANLEKNQKTLMIGDGVNDAPALALASCSIAISGIAIAGENADCILVKNNLLAIKKLWHIANLSQKIIKQNIIFALSYNTIFIPIAFLGLINPIIAAIAMPISSLIVIINSIRIKKYQVK